MDINSQEHINGSEDEELSAVINEINDHFT